MLPMALFCQDWQPKYHKVVKNDNYTIIANKYGTCVDSLKQWNPGVKPNNIPQGKDLIVGWQEISSSEKAMETTNTEMNTEEEYKQQSADNSSGKNTTAKDKNKSERKNDKVKTQKENEKNNRFISWGPLLIGMLFGIVLGITLLYFYFAKKLKIEHERKERELSRRVAELREEKAGLISEVSRLRTKIQSIEKEKQQFLDENVVLGEEIDRLKATGHEVSENREKNANTISSQVSVSPTVLYADAIIEDCFAKIREVPNDDTMFILNLQGENSADFSIYKTSYQRVIANPAFLEGCEKQILGSSTLEIVSKGTAQKDASNGKWKVTNKLNVIIK